ncbi:MAG TPA: N-acetylglucosamine-6-phosphate deacetylase [Clostridiaceae bacterium]|nr:N-acetylglucosamine-6-phosphate deacetylase [Clostridiaceae bacterium]
MLFRNFRIIYPDRIETGDLQVQNGKITRIGNIDTEDQEGVLEGNGRYLSPGFIDIHIHGAGGKDTMEGTFDALNTISEVLATHGTTSFLPTTMTMGVEAIRTAIAAAADAMGRTKGAAIIGVHLEGPFISSNAIGAQNPNYVKSPDIASYEEMTRGHGDIVRNITLAPEAEGAKELIPYLRERGVNVSIGHTKATYEEAMEGIRLGCNHSTHLFNAMTPMTHRAPGVVGAIFDSDITTETISDGIHIAYPVLRMAYRQKTSDRVLLVTDAMEACGMPEGTYSLGGQDVITKDGAARLRSGALAGSILTMDQAVRNVLKNTSLPLHEIVKMASLNGAVFAKVDDRKGRIAEGYDADLVIFDEEIHVDHVFIEGRQYR